MKNRVLIVDDSLTVRMDLQEAFESIGLAVTTTETLAAARKTLVENPFSLIILDVLLPDGDGLELLREVKNAPGTAAVPVILLSTEAEVCDRVRGLKTGADEYIGKPYDRPNLLSRARQLVRVEKLSAGSAPTLLLIDDSVTFREEFKTVLETAGYNVATAENGEEGLRSIVATRPDAVIIDAIMQGGLDGVGVIRRVKDDITLRNIPCLLLTATDSVGDESRILEVGADAYIRKGTANELIMARVAALLRSPDTSPAQLKVPGLLAPKKILAVDDSPTYLNELTEELQKEGYDVIQARSGKEALELLEVEQLDCILLDLIMPGLSGQETCRIIKKAPAWRNTPVLILTAVEETKAMVEGINSGADDYIPKSADFEVLKARLRAQLRRKQFEDEYRAIREQLLQKEVETARAKAAQEVAEARAAFEPLLRNEAWLNNVVRIAHLGAWDWDILKNAQTWSDEQFRILGRAPNSVEASYNNFLQTIYPEDRGRVETAINKALAEEPRFQIDCRVLWPNGELRHVICQGEIYRNGVNHPVRIVGTVLDVTGRKRVEEEVRKLNVELEERVLQRTSELGSANKELEAFTYSVSHDLRSPLRHVHGFSNLLQRDPKSALSARGRHLLDSIIEGTVRMERLLEDLLNLSRFGKQAVHRRTVRLNDLVQDVIHDLAPEAAGRKIEWKVAELPEANCDPALMKIVFVNLLGNAVKYTRARTTAIIEMGQLLVQGDPVLFVRDNGAGFDMNDVGRLFGVFQRLHSEEDFEGTGIGLAIVQRIVQKHGGRVWAEGEVDKGATFYFTLGTPETIEIEKRAAIIGKERTEPVEVTD